MADHAIPEQALAQHMAVLGKTGSGKTSTAKLAVEQVVAGGGRVCVLDPIKSDWWGLTSSTDGKHAGLPFYILGGPHGHVPLHSASGKSIGNLVASGALPLSIIDMADFEPGGLQKFFSDFAQALLRGMRGVVYLVVEEAHEFAPKERSGMGAETLAIHWAKKLATAGRSKGIRLILATQRTQSLHNALLGSCETMIVHRMTAPADQEPVKKWLHANTSKDVQAQVASSLASLKTGTGWLCSGEAGIFERREFPRITTLDNSATPTNDTAVREVKTAPVDQERLRTIIGEAVAAAEANDPAKLKAEIARLQVEARKGSAPVDDPTVLDNLQSARGYIEELEQRCKTSELECERARKENVLWRAKVESFRDWLVSTAGGLSHWPDDIKDQLQEISAAPQSVAEVSAPSSNPLPPRFPAATVISKKPVVFIDGLTAPQQKVLSSLEFWRSVGHDAPTREQIAAVAGYAPGSGNFGNIVGSLRTAGKVEIPQPGCVSLAPGVRFKGLTPMDAAEHLRGVLNAPQKKLVFAALRAPVLTRDRLAEVTGYAVGSGNFGNLIGSLCTLAIFVKPQSGSVALTGWAREVLEGSER